MLGVVVLDRGYVVIVAEELVVFGKCLAMAGWQWQGWRRRGWRPGWRQELWPATLETSWPRGGVGIQPPCEGSNGLALL